jgi:Rieske Fe-S protein
MRHRFEEMQTVKIARRRFLVAAGTSVLACSSSSSDTSCVGDGAGPGLAYCLVQKKTIRVAGGAAIPVGQAVIVTIDDDSSAALLRDAKGLYALGATCPHACCTVRLCGGDACAAPARAEPACGALAPSPIVSVGPAFLCPCHGSQFDAAGAVTKGPATRPLPSVALRVEGSDVVIDLSTPAPRDARI